MYSRLFRCLDFVPWSNSTLICRSGVGFPRISASCEVLIRSVSGWNTHSDDIEESSGRRKPLSMVLVMISLAIGVKGGSG